jgi:hypothetical protein
MHISFSFCIYVLLASTVLAANTTTVIDGPDCLAGINCEKGCKKLLPQCISARPSIDDAQICWNGIDCINRCQFWLDKCLAIQIQQEALRPNLKCIGLDYGLYGIVMTCVGILWGMTEVFMFDPKRCRRDDSPNVNMWSIYATILFALPKLIYSFVACKIGLHTLLVITSMYNIGIKMILEAHRAAYFNKGATRESARLMVIGAVVALVLLVGLFILLILGLGTGTFAVGSPSWIFLIVAVSSGGLTTICCMCSNPVWKRLVMLYVGLIEVAIAFHLGLVVGDSKGWPTDVIKTIVAASAELTLFVRL